MSRYSGNSLPRRLWKHLAHSHPTIFWHEAHKSFLFSQKIVKGIHQSID